MKCRYCNVVLAPLRSLTDGEFCCDEHRRIFHEEQAAPRQQAAPLESSLNSLHAAIMSREPVSPTPVTAPSPPALEQLLALHFERNPSSVPQSDHNKPAAEPSYPATPVIPAAEGHPVSISAPDVAVEPDVPLHPSRDAAASWRWLSDAWKNAPSDLKVVTLLLPLLLAVAVSPSVPRVRIPRIGDGGVQQLVATRWKNLHQSISNRAAVAFADDFRSGLDSWESRSNLTASWSYDAAGFVQPGPLAVFKPTVDMADYRFEFLGEIDQKGLGCAFRASDLDNYYALKFTVVKPGPLPLVHMIRYAVINGKEVSRMEKPLPLTARSDMLYRVLLDVRGGDFTIMAQGQVVDFWSDNRLPRGGVGFFCSRGEKARVRWVEVSHQYDTLGRLCAYLAPYGIEGRNGNWN